LSTHVAIVTSGRFKIQNPLALASSGIMLKEKASWQ
jgi:hypothetical protein